MNKLKKNLIYQFMFVSAVLVMSSVYLWWSVAILRGDMGNYIPDMWFLDDVAVMVFSMIVQIILFVICSYWYYAKISRFIDESTQQQLQERNQIFANIAHDFKSLLTGVIGLARALEEGVASVDEQSQIAKIMAKKAIQMDRIINLMVQYAKMNSNAYSLRKVPIDITRNVKELVALRYHEFEQKEMALEIAFAQEKIMAQVDEVEFSRCIDNLISNAIGHNSNGTRIQVGVMDHGKKVKIWVADSGNPIEKTLYSNIFEPFISGDEARSKKEASGLGLAITKKIVEMHGGDIFIDEHVKGYTKAFVIYISKE